MNRRRDWLAGLLIGAVGGFATFYIPPLGLAVLGWIVVATVLGGTRRLAAAGAMIGAGAVWVLILAGAAARCANFDARANQECVAPDLRPWLVAAAVLIAVGVGVSARAARGSR